jgi:hypothetical protein
VSLLGVLALTACVPVVSYQYDIKGQGDKSESGGCSPTTEVLLTTHLTTATSVVFWGSVERLHDSNRIVSISFTFSKDEVLTLTKPEVTIESATYSNPKVVPITTVRRSSRIGSPSCDPPDESEYQPPNQPMDRTRDPLNSVYVIDIAVPNNPPDFTIHFPHVQLDGKQIDVPAVTFVRKSTVSLPAQLM